MEQGNGGGIEKQENTNETYAEYPEERKPALFLMFKNILIWKKKCIINRKW